MQLTLNKQTALYVIRSLRSNTRFPLVAALLRLPIDDLGFDFGPLTLNPRVDHTHALPGSKGSRVPDIVIGDTDIGLNYDGLAHLDLDSIVKAALDMGLHPGASQTQIALDHAVRDVREKAVDDIRRNRELATEGKTVFPLLKEDLYVPGGFEQIVSLLVELLETSTKRDMRRQKSALKMKALSKARHQVMLSLLPGRHERNVQVGRFLSGHKLCDDPLEMRECWIEF